MNTKQDSAAQTRKSLIIAAIDIIQTQGIHGLTLEAVARQAGVSKGGLLHHFPSKEALTEMILRQLFADFEAQVQHYYDQEIARAGRWLRAYVRATFEEQQPPQEMIMLLLSALLESPKLIGLVQQDFAHWQERLLNDGLPQARATIIRQATDAYWTEKLMGVTPYDPAARHDLMLELLKLTDIETQ